MSDPWTDRWNERYNKEEFAFGEQPNEYLKEQLEKLKIGTILFQQREKGVTQFLRLNLVGTFLRLTSV